MGHGIERTHGNPQHHSIAKHPTRSAPASSTEGLPSLASLHSLPSLASLTGIARSTLEEVAQSVLAITGTLTATIGWSPVHPGPRKPRAVGSLTATKICNPGEET